MILLDTHTLIWWITDPNKLSKKAKETVSKELINGQITISSISIWEVALLLKHNKIDFGAGVEEFINSVYQIKEIRSVAVDNEIAIKSVNLDWAHPDPVDRIIVATALSLGCSLVTKDSKIHNSKLVKTIW